MKVKLKINIRKPVSGQQIADAVKKIAGKEFIKATPLDDTKSNKRFTLGQKSLYPYRDLVIGVGSKAIPEISMKETYNEVYVCAWNFGDGKYNIAYNDSDVEKAVRDFLDKLQQLL